MGWARRSRCNEGCQPETLAPCSGLDRVVEASGPLRVKNRGEAVPWRTGVYMPGGLVVVWIARTVGGAVVLLIGKGG